LACVLLQVQSRTMQEPQVISGPMVLAKSPVSHMGDVRRVEAVAPGGWAGRQLAADYVNVVVFSQQGQRPLTNMLAGSDLVRRTWRDAHAALK
jgi:RNA-dependent RNA polymerase